MDEETQNLARRVKTLEAQVAALIGSSQYTFQKGVKLYDGRNIQLGYQTGTQVGTNANQKLGFFGATPVVKHASTPATVADVIALLQAYGLTN